MSTLEPLTEGLAHGKIPLEDNAIYCGDARDLLRQVRPSTVDLSFWSPPYFVGKSYERDLKYQDWQDMLDEVIALHFDIIKPGGFLAINIADILAFSRSGDAQDSGR